MAKYTVELGLLLENNFDLCLDEYPIFDSDYREVLNKKITKHFYFHEIGFETPERFRFELRNKLNEIMPYYNQFYESAKIAYDPLTTYKGIVSILRDETVNTTGNKKDTLNIASDTTAVQNGKDIASNTPKSLLSVDDIENAKYASSASLSKLESEGASTQEQEANTDITNDSTRKNVDSISEEGYKMPPSDLIIKYRETFLNIDMQIIEELNEVFLQIY